MDIPKTAVEAAADVISQQILNRPLVNCNPLTQHAFITDAEQVLRAALPGIEAALRTLAAADVCAAKDAVIRGTRRMPASALFAYDDAARAVQEGTPR